MDRRRFLQAVATGSLVVAGGGLTTACQRLWPPGVAPDVYGPLAAPDANGLRLPAGFTSRVVATSGQVVAGTGFTWHGDPDGGACFRQPGGGWIYVSNAERVNGGASMLRFAPDGTIVEARTILSGTIANCAGGSTPWGTWLSCEERTYGRVWECDPTGVAPAAVRDPMGSFKHEAAACDPGRQVVYLTEDQSDGALYRFTPTTWRDLSAGLLEVLTDVAGTLAWAPVPNPNPGLSDTPTRDQVANTRRFAGGEGIVVDGNGKAFFTTKGDNRVWLYDPAGPSLTIVYDDSTSPTPTLTGVDNITIDRTGLLYVAEDGGNLEIVCVGLEEQAVPVVQLTGVTGSEITGPAFSPDGSRLYFSSQRNPGRTYEVTGPWR